jgi:hypothetical protein
MHGDSGFGLLLQDLEQSLPVKLAAAVKRKRTQEPDITRDHVRWQFRPQFRNQTCDVQSLGLDKYLNPIRASLC